MNAWQRLERWIDKERTRARAHMSHHAEGTMQHTAWLNTVATLNEVEDAMRGIRAGIDNEAAHDLPPLPDRFDAEYFARSVLAMVAEGGHAPMHTADHEGDTP